MKGLVIFLLLLVLALAVACTVLALYIWNAKFRAFIKKCAGGLPDLDGKEDAQ